ncbi:DoxX family protein [Polaribacter sp. Hel1_85]|uniref:DoxX family protein n=1 Tax=Polaribacter sp. Hel1_85 TaxID=1250005 RepID=UPI00052C5B4B|nr:DoxX family protein [Polaribacter sp. Hel1_85]KGL64191.1 conserved hypothetical membrane protein, DoxX-like family [Polaribacter sp. Hel1_85]
MKKLISQTINAISIFTMLFFAIPKLLAKPTSVAGFKQFEKVIHLNADLFMIFTGISELSMTILILYFAIIQKIKVGIFAYAFLFITMISALSLEFFARPEPKIVLVIIAFVLALFSIYQLIYLKNKYPKTTINIR